MFKFDDTIYVRYKILSDCECLVGLSHNKTEFLDEEVKVIHPSTLIDYVHGRTFYKGVKYSWRRIYD